MSTSRSASAAPMARADVAEHRERSPIVVGCEGQSAKSVGHHADDFERDAIDEQAAAENGRVAREQPIPAAVAEDHHRSSRGGSVVGRQQRASHRGLTPSTWKKLPVTNVPHIKRPSTRLSTWDRSA